MLSRSQLLTTTKVHKSRSNRSFDSAELFRTAIISDNAAYGPLPRQVDLRRWMSPIVNQDYMNTCVSSAFASACEYLLKRRNGVYTPISRLFIYFNGQIIDQRTRNVEDAGASRKNVVVGMRKYGICKEELWPYDRRLLNRKPPPDVYQAARQHTIVPLRLPLEVNAIRTCLANQIPAVIAVKMKYEINGEANANGGYISIPDPSDYEIAYLTSHAILIVGYDDDTEHFIARNSWGRDWGYYGYCFLPYQYLLDERLVNYPDYSWAITQIVPRMDYSPPMRSLTTTQYYQTDSRCRRSRKKLRQSSTKMFLVTTPGV
ncbi:unnamed protein product [Adineta ricciae]|uniref:Peptidase C1A papain C-terminal domain-containing protein n=1 Tax=Adineta ricciae TaxID=249248 RepID=A0A813VKA7_ADIRI|nr:unnamed protein product [Adineta ricciae]